MKASICVLYLAAALPWVAVHPGMAAQAATGDPQRASSDALLQTDARLQAKVSRADKNRPLGELLAELGAQIHVSLRASPDTADDKVSLFLDDRPAAEIMSLVARQLDFQWTRRGKGYELSQSVESRRRDAERWEKETAPQWEAIDGHMRLLARQLALSPAERDARQSEISRELAAPELAPADRERLSEEQRAMADLKPPFARAAVTLFSSLTPEQIRQLRSGRDIRFSTFDHSLPPELLESIQQGYAARVKGSPLERDLPRQQVDVNIRLTDFTGPLYSPERAARHSLQLEIGLTLGDANEYAPAGWFPTMPREKAPPPIVTTTDDPALKQAVSLLTAIARPPQAPAVQQPPGGSPGRVGTTYIVGGGGGGRPPGGWPAGLLTLGDLGEAVHKATGLEVVADSFIRARIKSQDLAAKRPLVEVLDRISNDLQYDWRKEGHLILLRSRTYYRDRAEEVPDRILVPWRTQVAAGEGPTLDRLAALAAALNEYQARGMHDFWGWYLEGTPVATGQWASDFYQNRYHLRLWAGLSPAQRQAALARQAIPIALMPAAEREAFVQALTARDEAVWGPMRFPRTLTPADLATASFSLEVRSFQEQRFRRTLPSGGSIEFSQPLDKAPTGFIAGPGETGPHAEPVGPATWLDGYTFLYRLAGQEEPVLKMPMNLPRAAPRR